MNDKAIEAAADMRERAALEIIKWGDATLGEARDTIGYPAFYKLVDTIRALPLTDTKKPADGAG